MFNKAAHFININVFWVVFVCVFFFYFWSAYFSKEDKNTDNWVLKDQTQYKMHFCLSTKKYEYHIQNLKLMNQKTFNGFQTTKVK